MSGRLEDKVVALTGIGGGQGRAAALLFAREGALVVGCDKDPQTAAETHRLADEAGHPITSTGVADLADPDVVHDWIKQVADVHGRIDVLYNNASRPIFGAFPDQPRAEYEFTVANEIDLVWHACQAAWPYLAATRGNILNTASIAGIIGTRDLKQAAHVTTKGAIIAFTRQLAAEGAEFGIRANSVSPGVITSPPVQQQLDEFGDKVPFYSQIKASGQHEPGRPEDVAYAALFLVSDEARYVNGENLVVDGGSTVLLG
jgi:NAD(P)-dependent dehydrogenase (short-subunit alcohol dehydrogenase family)